MYLFAPSSHAVIYIPPRRCVWIGGGGILQNGRTTLRPAAFRPAPLRPASFRPATFRPARFFATQRWLSLALLVRRNTEFIVARVGLRVEPERAWAVICDAGREDLVVSAKNAREDDCNFFSKSHFLANIQSTNG